MVFLAIFVLSMLLAGSQAAVEHVQDTVRQDTETFIDDRPITEIGGEGSKVASGTASKAMEQLDYCTLFIVFQNQMQLCGGTLVHPRFVLTSATCVYDPVELTATVVNVTFPNLKMNSVNTKLALFIHPMYDPVMHLNDIALIKLNRTMTTKEIDMKALSIYKLVQNATADYAGLIGRACGFGTTTNNNPTYPKTLQCTDLNVIPFANCTSTAPAFTAAATHVCAQWPDRDNNLCNGDYGGPLYTFSTFSNNGSVMPDTVQIIGIASFSPNYRPAASCQDGHQMVFTMVGAFYEWINSTAGNNTA